MKGNVYFKQGSLKEVGILYILNKKCLKETVQHDTHLSGVQQECTVNTYLSCPMYICLNGFDLKICQAQKLTKFSFFLFFYKPKQKKYTGNVSGGNVNQRLGTF